MILFRLLVVIVGLGSIPLAVTLKCIDCGVSINIQGGPKKFMN